ncbi:MAG: pantoate--beta-alanine ligase [Actinomycetota bacterium]
MTRILRRKAELDGLPDVTGRTAVVMTMGALHDGHASLVHGARGLAGADGRVIVTVFVNPLQFGAGEDFERYPRALDDDVAIASDAGADVVFAPEVDEVYPPADSPAAAIMIDPGPLGTELEGAARPGHFAGMLTVVAKLMHMTRPDVALFGEKDYQQLVLVRAMARALDFSVEIIGMPTVREADGLAMSSRNRYLSADARGVAAQIPVALAAGQAAGPDGAHAVVDAVRRHLDQSAASAGVPVDVDYVVVRSLDLGPAPRSGAARLLVTVVVDGTRLLDNVDVHLGPQSVR